MSRPLPLDTPAPSRAARLSRYVAIILTVGSALFIFILGLEFLKGGASGMAGFLRGLRGAGAGNNSYELSARYGAGAAGAPAELACRGQAGGALANRLAARSRLRSDHRRPPRPPPSRGRVPSRCRAPALFLSPLRPSSPQHRQRPPR